ncbi:MAG: hypothetical protein JWQ21_663 [Herminiimonas sp.]|nr:hypothetical protein [Herminiimonas sp.]
MVMAPETVENRSIAVSDRHPFRQSAKRIDGSADQAAPQCIENHENHFL